MYLKATKLLSPVSGVIAMALVLVLMPVSAKAEEAQAMTIKASRSEYNNNTGILIYEGQVELLQGNMTILADRLEVVLENDIVTLATANGNPTQFKHIRENSEQPVHAEGQNLSYIVTDRIIIFKDNASLIQGNSKMTGASISYSIDTGLATVTGDPGVGDGRMEMIFSPATTENE